MDAKNFLDLMDFPSLWVELEMYPEELARDQLSHYVAGHEDSSEHDRNGAFHWWLKQNPSLEILYKLVDLSIADPDQVMASDVRRHIKNSPNSDSRLVAYIDRAESILSRSDL